MPRILVTDGNIGAHVAEMLAARGDTVRVMTRKVTPNTRRKALGIEQVAADMGDPASLASAFANVDKFFSVTPFVENLVELGRNVMTAAKQAGVQYIVRSSVAGASAGGITVGRWHWAVEQEVEASGIPFTILQPNTFMQSYLMHARSIATDNTFYLPQGDGRVSLVDVRDIAAVAVACLTESGHAGKRYVLTGSEALSNTEVAAKFSALLGRTISYTDVTPAAMQQSLAGSGTPAWMIDALLELFDICKAGMAGGIAPTVAQIVHRSPFSFDRFLADHAAAFH
jgi:uncharacterized protein YbjT (DUF2867 family)